jgi:hypothetical protein
MFLLGKMPTNNYKIKINNSKMIRNKKPMNFNLWQRTTFNQKKNKYIKNIKK